MTQPRTVGGRYELGELIGYGGMAEVHRGHDTRLNREVAIKVLRADLARDPSFLNRFRREAHSAAGLNHPSIVSVYDTGEDFAPDGTVVPFIVMEFIDGRTLRDIIKSEGRLPPRRALEIVADICSALEFSHRNGIVHRDIKPANVMITPNGAVKVMDFGIARAVADTSATQTQTANVIGTAQYLSPEQARGEAVDARSDVYSTGCLLYELVTGAPPFQGDSPVAVAYQHVRENPVAPSARVPDLPRSVDSIVMKALAKNPLNRYQSAGEMRADIQRALADQPVNAEAVMSDAERTQFIARTPPPPMPGRPGAPEPEEEDHSRRNALIWAAVVIALLLVVGIGAYFIAFTGKDDNKPQTVNVPSLYGQTPAAAAALLRAQKLVPQQGTPTGGPCEDNNPGRSDAVCSTTPAVGQEIKQGRTVQYHLFDPKLAYVPVPLVETMSYVDAVRALNKAGLGYRKHNVYQFGDRGNVLSQSPRGYTKVKSGTVVTLDVPTGTVKMPDVLKPKQSLSNAQNSLSTTGFTNIVAQPSTTHDQKKANLVFEQSPEAGKPYAQNQKIILSYYRYKPKPLPTCPTTPATPSSPASASSGAPTTTTPATPSSPATPTLPSNGSSPTCTPR